MHYYYYDDYYSQLSCLTWIIIVKGGSYFGLWMDYLCTDYGCGHSIHLHTELLLSLHELFIDLPNPCLIRRKNGTAVTFCHVCKCYYDVTFQNEFIVHISIYDIVLVWIKLLMYIKV